MKTPQQIAKQIEQRLLLEFADTRFTRDAAKRLEARLLELIDLNEVKETFTLTHHDRSLRVDDELDFSLLKLIGCTLPRNTPYTVKTKLGTWGFIAYEGIRNYSGVVDVSVILYPVTSSFKVMRPV